jgi:Uma2 family endonuclease
MATVSAPIEQRFRLSAVPWDAYVKIGEAIGERPIRINYDRGELEIMTVSPEHERNKKLLGRLIEALTEEMEIDVASGGSMTFQREDLLRGMEPDDCYWIANEPAVRGRIDIDFETDPPPDLALETEITRSVLDRLGILAALRVPEVWRWNGETLRVLLLSTEGKYVESEQSKAFPFLPIAELAKFLTQTELSETQMIRKFRAWVREQNAGGWQA